MPIGGSASWQERVVPENGHRAVAAAGEHAADRDDRERDERRHERQVGRQAEDALVGPLGQQVLLEEQLDAVGQRLQDAPRPGPVRADAVLHVGDDLALEPDHQHRGDQQEHEHDDRLDEHDDHDAEVEPGDEERVDQSDAIIGVSTRTSVTGAWRR